MVFHPPVGTTSYYTCIFTGQVGADETTSNNSTGSAAHIETTTAFLLVLETTSRLARDQPGCLGVDCTSNDRTQVVIHISYWSDEATMLKWQTYLQGSMVVNAAAAQQEEDQQQHDRRPSYSDYHIHVGKVEPPPTVPRRSGKVSPDREDVAYDTTMPGRSQEAPSPPPPAPLADNNNNNHTQEHNIYQNEKKKQKKDHLLTPVDVPPVYDPTSISAMNGRSGGEPDSIACLSSPHDLSADLSIFECFAQSLDVAVANKAHDGGDDDDDDDDDKTPPVMMIERLPVRSSARRSTPLGSADVVAAAKFRDNRKRSYGPIVSLPSPPTDDDDNDHDNDDHEEVSVRPVVKNIFAGNVSKLHRRGPCVPENAKDDDDDPVLSMADSEGGKALSPATNNDRNSIFQYVLGDPDPPTAVAAVRARALTASSSSNQRKTRSNMRGTAKTATAKVSKSTSTSSRRTKHCQNDTTNTKTINPFVEIARDEELRYKVTILMAMHSRHRPAATSSAASSSGTTTNSIYTSTPPDGAMMRVGFLWEHFPFCERVLEECAAEYFSACYQRSSADEMWQLNDAIVERLQRVVAARRYAVHPDFCEGKLRERVRCYYKTLIANAKKRLTTLAKHVDDVENQEYVSIFIRCAHNPQLTLRESVAMAAGTDRDSRHRPGRLMGKVEQLRRIVEG